jgi:serine/threonine protein kinase
MLVFKKPLLIIFCLLQYSFAALQEIGKGSSSTVYYDSDKPNLAIKIFKSNDILTMTKSLREYRIMKDDLGLFADWTKYENRPAIIMTRYHGETLQKLIDQNKLKRSMINPIISKIKAIIKDQRKKGVDMSDPHAENFIFDAATNEVHAIDFGEAVRKKDDNVKYSEAVLRTDGFVNELKNVLSRAATLAEAEQETLPLPIVPADFSRSPASPKSSARSRLSPDPKPARLYKPKISQDLGSDKKRKLEALEGFEDRVSDWKRFQGRSKQNMRSN